MVGREIARLTAPTKGREGAGSRSPMQSQVPRVFGALGRLPRRPALGAALRISGHSPSVTLNRAADRYTAGRNGQGMSQLR